MKNQIRAIISFWELPENWQVEARSNLDELAEDNMYLEPLDTENPNDHVLWDLSEAMRTGNGPEYDAVITISNNSALGLKFTSASCDEVELIFL